METNYIDLLYRLACMEKCKRENADVQVSVVEFPLNTRARLALLMGGGVIMVNVTIAGAEQETGETSDAISSYECLCSAL